MRPVLLFGTETETPEHVQLKLPTSIFRYVFQMLLDIILWTSARNGPRH
ncbi:MAG: hypothetical protein O7C39_00580 [Bacteroidetes bacterium]|nr:hypothetical protein [Bacteroidota bacterium]